MLQLIFQLTGDVFRRFGTCPRWKKSDNSVLALFYAGFETFLSIYVVYLCTGTRPR